MTEKDYRYILKNQLIQYRDTLNLPKKVTFGIEIEYENIVTDFFSDILDEAKFFDDKLYEWENKNEIDISELNSKYQCVNGEINSPILKDKLQTWKSLKKIMELLYKHDGIITNRCGGHVNIGAHILENNSEYYRNLFLIWKLYKTEIYKFASGEFIKVRPDVNDLFQSISKELSIDKIMNTSSKTYLKGLENIISDKVHDLNVCKDVRKNISYKNVIEFRIPNGSMREEVWQNYINFFSKLLLACKKELDIEKILYKINNNEHNSVELADLIFNDQIDKNNFLIQTLKTNKVYKKELPEHITYYE